MFRRIVIASVDPANNEFTANYTDPKLGGVFQGHVYTRQRSLLVLVQNPGHRRL